MCPIISGTIRTVTNFLPSYTSRFFPTAKGKIIDLRDQTEILFERERILFVPPFKFFCSFSFTIFFWFVTTPVLSGDKRFNKLYEIKGPFQREREIFFNLNKIKL